MEELPIIQKTYDLIKWYVPILNRLPKNHRFLLGDRMASSLYDLLEQLIKARYEQQKLPRLENLNSQLDILRYQTRLLLDFQEMDAKRYGYICQRLDAIGNELGGWIRQQKGKPHEAPRKSLA
ncbi:diversity-generating retroelement protein Avd [Leptothoe sp. PORK10 BA2]|uniref:diversity-generating retroelement protein Avd n=1 Tax=Leptothoe sp. PORK10 BA2 TaxID=3110254 RepID=UPI002B1FEE54|nr:diversity-generating retroelement protein Avd [Leptothoe sp. PORK10 BA2]MEA5464351.1 diversity-generating retroelement protein Avd [Leptothoe sp. PORK10 BA2]